MHHNITSLIAFLTNPENCLAFVPREDERVVRQTLWDIAPLCPGDPERLPLAVAASEDAPSMMEALDHLFRIHGSVVVGPQAIYCSDPSVLLLFAQTLRAAFMEGDSEYAFRAFPVELDEEHVLSMRIEDGDKGKVVFFEKHRIPAQYQPPAETDELDAQSRADFENDEGDERIEHDV